VTGLDPAATAILRAMERLNLRTDFDPASLPAHAYSLGEMLKWARWSAHPRAQTGRKRNAAKGQLVEIRDAAAALYNMLERANGDTLAALDSELGRAALTLSAPLRNLAHAAHKAAEAAPETPPRKGAPVDAVAMAAATVTRGAYETLTGRQARRVHDAIEGVETGEFFDFLAAVLKAAGIDASAEHLARQVARVSMERNPQK
jgi:hypothetical protein